MEKEREDFRGGGSETGGREREREEVEREAFEFCKEEEKETLLFLQKTSSSVLSPPLVISSHGACLSSSGNGRRGTVPRGRSARAKQRNEGEAALPAAGFVVKRRCLVKGAYIDFSSLFPPFLSLFLSPSQAVSKRIQNAKSNKFFGNIHKRGLVQNTTQVRGKERERKREKQRRDFGATKKLRLKKKRDAPLLLNLDLLFSLPQNKTLSQQKKKGSGSNVGPIMLGFFLFVVVGSALLQIIRTATSGGI